MNSLYTLVVGIQVCMALIIIALVLVQHGKGADMGAAFGSGASGSLFGATGSSSFLSKSTGIAAAIFFCATLALAYIGNSRTAPTSGVMSDLVSAPKVVENAVVEKNVANGNSAEKSTDNLPAPSATGTQQHVVNTKTTPAHSSSTAPVPTNKADQIPK